MNVWKTTIGDSGLYISDGNYSSKYPRKDDFVPTGAPFISANNLKNGRINWDGMRYISQEQHASLKKGHIRTGDVLLVTRGSLGLSARVTADFNDANINAQLVLLRADNQTIDSRFLYFLVSSQEFFHSVRSFASGTAQPQLPIRALTKIPLAIPPFPIQRKIASTLSAYDDLIENNSRRIAILEEMAQAIYREWFVHFRFPGHENIKLVDSPLGLIPKEWEIKHISDFGNVITGKTPSTKTPENFGDYMPFIKTPSMHGNMFCIEVDDYLSEVGVESQKKKTLPPDTVIVNCIGALAGSVSITVTDSQTNQQINAVVLNSQQVREFLYLTLVGLRDTIRSYGSAGATMINLSKGKFEALTVVQPTAVVLSTFHDVTCSMLDSIRNLQRRNMVLKSTRNMLLPKLISGKLKVEDLDIDTGGLTEELEETTA